MSQCHLIEPLITPFVDDECTPYERALIATHLAGCEACRGRVESESAISQLLRAQATRARAVGNHPTWGPRVMRLGRPYLPAHSAFLAALIAVGIALGVGFWNRPLEASVVGVIGDSFCRIDHQRAMLQGSNDHQADLACAHKCIREGAQYILISDGRVYKIRNQSLPELWTFAADRVRVEGKVRGEFITISSIGPAETVQARLQ